MAISPGLMIGPYEILSRLGVGGMGEVYCAKDRRLGRKVAIKVLLPAFAEDRERLGRFEQETRTRALLKHPNILQIYDSGSHEGSPYIVMEMLEGENLRDRLDGKALPLRKALEIAKQIARGLAAAHEKGITHRDLKPENIFLMNDDRVKILDFGLAKFRIPESANTEITQALAAIPSVTEVGMVVGTVGYLSPEQVVGRAADFRSDIFSFGVVLWEMLYGVRPFRGASTVETMHAILKDDPLVVDPEIPLPQELLRILYRCIEKDPKARFQSALDLAFSLDSMAFTSLSQMVPAMPTKRRRLWAWAVASGLGLLLLGGGLWMGAGPRAKRQALSFQRLTYQNGRIQGARLGPDGVTYVYSVSFGGGPCELRMGRMDGLGTRSLGMPLGSRVLSISQNGEMALLLNASEDGPGLLARVPMSGGAPREIASGVYAADWSPDGKALAIVRDSPGNRWRVEYPIGNPVFEAPNTFKLGGLSVSPKGDQVAFSVISSVAVGELRVVDQKGKGKVLVKGQCDSPVWSPKGDEILFPKVFQDDRRELRAVTLSGRERLLYPVLGRVTIHDISPNGKVLMDHLLVRHGILAKGPKDAAERDLSWLQSSLVADMSPDGQSMLFGELAEGRETGGAYLRRFDGTEAVRLGEGDPLSLSPDGRWALVHVMGTGELSLLPTGEGLARKLPCPGIRPKWGVFLRDGQRLIVAAMDGSNRFGYFLQHLDTGELIRLPWDVTPSAFVATSPDGDTVAVGSEEGRIRLYSLSGKTTRVLHGFSEGETVIQWSGDGRSFYTSDLMKLPGRVYRVDAATGHRTLWQTLDPSICRGSDLISYVAVSADGRSYAYSYRQVMASDLYLMDGWK
jgi:Tol biopolymer transport system component/predicted Ser/Thr protein kinase